ncbi:hypothetical protein G7K_0317-t1 [Saitoella complicata NRRL Y-17804]|uniref:RRM domain-containing protein n=1 Tax=Saitoella complicata (strain BCRC 22490 / CBS 7301 / JCM 7358 / NBRC 10748 / NRRL Y-17804) TaxID=698492 RepID=A0A0E9N8C0_SAICN|nr:hypothetical protein G7K_0317-t1 [Saitoella complicata NRRL Y-17804]
MNIFDELPVTPGIFTQQTFFPSPPHKTREPFNRTPLSQPSTPETPSKPSLADTTCLPRRRATPDPVSATFRSGMRRWTRIGYTSPSGRTHGLDEQLLSTSPISPSSPSSNSTRRLQRPANIASIYTDDVDRRHQTTSPRAAMARHYLATTLEQASISDHGLLHTAHNSTDLFAYRTVEAGGSNAVSMSPSLSSNGYEGGLGGKWGATPSRYLQVGNLPKTAELWALKEMFESLGSLQGIVVKDLRVDGTIIAAFHDLRDAISTLKRLRHQRYFNDRRLDARFCSRAAVVALTHQDSEMPLISENEGEITISAFHHDDKEIPVKLLQDILSNYGDLRSFRSAGAGRGQVFICEYFDCRDAEEALKALHDRVVEGFFLSVVYHEGDDVSSWRAVSNVLRRTQDEGKIFEPQPRRGSHPHLSGFESWCEQRQPRSPLSPLHPSADYLEVRRGSTGTLPSQPRRLNRVRSKLMMEVEPLSPRSIGPERRVPLSPYASSFEPSSPALIPGRWRRERERERSIGSGIGTPLSERFEATDFFVHGSPQSRHYLDDEGISPTTTRFRGSLRAADMARSVTYDGAAIGYGQSYDDVPMPSPLMSPGIDSGFGQPFHEKNKVNLDRIANGADMRTTIMIKNVPNKYTSTMLQEYINDSFSFKGAYDFLYLRMDFQNRCNVGYAFVNFTDPMHILHFAEHRLGTKWNRFHSEKRCEITYANIQGKDCLVEKFRNSSVMDHIEEYRPKLFHVSGHLAGQEQEFPMSNNMKRKMRSVASAAQVGLYPPASGKETWRNRDVDY